MKNQKIILHIDTTDRQETRVNLVVQGKHLSYHEKTISTQSQQLLPLVQRALSENHLTLKDLTEITVNTGPGSFTGVRIGVAIANVLSWTLGIPVNGKMQIHPTYSPSKFDE